MPFSILSICGQLLLHYLKVWYQSWARYECSHPNSFCCRQLCENCQCSRSGLWRQWESGQFPRTKRFVWLYKVCVCVFGCVPACLCVRLSRNDKLYFLIQNPEEALIFPFFQWSNMSVTKTIYGMTKPLLNFTHSCFSLACEWCLFSNDSYLLLFPLSIFSTLHLDDTSHESAEPSRGDVNSVGRVQTAGLLVTSSLLLLAAILSS